ncbi:MAG: hypothetical protein V1907_03560 [Candidatus Kerfeldbacteria bacterium]
MACFIAPTTAAIIVTAAKKKITPRFHVAWLLALLWGGVAWLIPEHIYHGEVVFYPPFFTAGLRHILSEILRVGVPMTVGAVAVWLVLIAFAALSRNKKLQPRFGYLMVVGAVMMILVDRMVS